MGALHLIFVALWGGVVLAEAVIEIAGVRRNEWAPAVAEMHFWIDVLVEAPILAGVFVTGGVLVSRVPIDTRLAVKIACGVVAVLANAVCIAAVIRRRRGPRRLGTTGTVFSTAVVGIPFAIVAAAMGLTRVLR